MKYFSFSRTSVSLRMAIKTAANVDSMQNMKEIDRRLKETMLHPAFIVRNYIHGDERFDYEKYLMEFVNASECFRNLSCGEAYKAPVSESHKECDANTLKYSIDFKLLIATSYGEAESMTSFQNYKIPGGGIITCSSKGKGTYTATRIVKALRGKSLSDLEQYKLLPNTEPAVKDIRQFLSVLETDKNLLFFYPSEFSIDSLEPDEDPFEITGDALDHDLNSAFRYRNEKAKKYDTYLSTIYEDKWVLYQFTEEKIQFVEVLPVEISSVYMAIQSFAAYDF